MKLLYKDLSENTWDVCVSETVIEGWTDISSITAWCEYKDFVSKDCKFIKSEIRALYDSIGWDNCTDGEKDVACRTFLATPAQILTKYTYEEQKELLSYHDDQMREARRLRFLNTKDLMIIHVQSEVDRVAVMTDILTYALDKTYIEYAIECKAIDGTDGIWDWVQGTEGTVFEDAGLANKSITVTGMTLSELVTACMDILQNGNY